MKDLLKTRLSLLLVITVAFFGFATFSYAVDEDEEDGELIEEDFIEEEGEGEEDPIIEEDPMEENPITDEPIIDAPEVITPAQVRITFVDVTTDAWYYDIVNIAYENGLMVGTLEKPQQNYYEFSPSGTLTVAQAVTMAAKVHASKNNPEYQFNDGNVWYEPYVAYAIQNGLINATDFTDYNATATRRFMAYIFANSIKDDNAQISTLTPPDVTPADQYGNEILKLYQLGILVGGDSTGKFAPDSSITRAEAAAIIVKVALPNLRTVA